MVNRSEGNFAKADQTFRGDFDLLAEPRRTIRGDDIGSQQSLFN